MFGVKTEGKARDKSIIGSFAPPRVGGYLLCHDNGIDSDTHPTLGTHVRALLRRGDRGPSTQGAGRAGEDRTSPGLVVVVCV